MRSESQPQSTVRDEMPTGSVKLRASGITTVKIWALPERRRGVRFIAALLVTAGLSFGAGTQTLPHPTSLSEVGVGSVAGVRIDGIDMNDHSGISVSGVRDVNGDGFDDFLIGANQAAPGGDSMGGETYLVFGSPDGIGSGGVLDLASLSGSDGLRIDGIDRFDESGWSVSGAGDVNGDGHSDVLIGARGGNSRVGETYLIFGSASGLGVGGALDLASLDGANGVRFDGAGSGGELGFSVSGAGDVNGDGCADILIGANLEDQTGVAYLLYGSPSMTGNGGVLSLSSLDASDGVRIAGIDAGDGLGHSVSGAGDVNGDGFADFLIGARGGDPGGAENAGEVYLIYGMASGIGAGGVLDLSSLTGTDGVLLQGIDAEDFAGASVSGADDVNGDGCADFLIGAPGKNLATPPHTGEAYLIFGSSSGIGSGGVLALSALNGVNGVLLGGIDDNDNTGHSVSGAGDINGDGHSDVFIGAHRADPLFENEGEIYLVYGSASGIGAGGSLGLGSLNGSNGVRFDGIEQEDHSGISVSGAGDVNGDGLADLVIGADQAPRTGTFQEGRTYLVHGAGSPVSSVSSFSLPGDSPRTPIGTVDGSSNIPTTRVWVDFDAGDNGTGGSSRESVTFHRSAVSGFAPLLVEPIFEWEISTNRVNHGTADVTFKGLGVRNEIDWGGLVLTTDDAGATWYAPPQTSDSLVHEVTVTDLVLPSQCALAVVPDTSPPRVIDAVLGDADNNSLADPGETLTLIMDRGVIVRPGQVNPSSFTLPVAGDSLGATGFAAAVNPLNSRLIEITLGASVSLAIPGDLGTGSSSGIDIAPGLPPTAIQSLYGVPAQSGPGVDIDYTVVPNTETIGTEGGTVAVTDSPDAAYTEHEIVIPSGALPTPGNIAFLPPGESGGQINTVQILVNGGNVSFATPATLTLEYRESDIDVEMGQSEDHMRIHQLVELSPSVFTWLPVPGEQTRDDEANTVSVEISNLNPVGTSGEVGTFATLPVNPITEATMPINPVEEGATGPRARLELLATVNPILRPDPKSIYTGHAIEFPGYTETAPDDPNRIDVTIREATLWDRTATGGRVSFPLENAAVFVIAACDAADNPIEFTDPVNITVEFQHSGERSDVFDFTNAPRDPAQMRLVHNELAGIAMVNFVHCSGVTQSVITTADGGAVVAEGVGGLTGSTGFGMWGAVALSASTPQAAQTLNYLLGLSFNPAGLDMDGDNRVTCADLVSLINSAP
jgi:FG-GAP repeat protein